MSSILNTSATIQHKTPLPSTLTGPQAITSLQNHEGFIKCDPHMISYKPLPESTSEPIPSTITCSPPAGRPAVVYEVTDRVHALPAGLWDSDVVSTYEFVDLEKGMFVRLRSPLSVVMETVWEVREVEGGGGGLELVEEVTISCSRLLVAVIKGQCEGNWKGIHGNLVAKMEGKEATEG
ncbi:Uncharacterized protein SAPIO_CDS3597 [Scedosporium apiospermum]|uniref:DUF7053 domain-containing protein n=1 Tax=Pseudallescheria apiosperma TaxID=563466 RepID=A0A084GB54_PSEDA|nr:Uncharacterized protein SAPIO_CDS3597 [Scedosporium apiospermum]KEZ44566.1 Uncharacterized protein SAPIO_CDS3597 [Scedosporium apiospermum]